MQTAAAGSTPKGTEDQRQEQREKTDDGKDHVLRATGQMGLRKPLLEIEPEKPAPERQDRDRDGYRDGRHRPPPFELLAIAIGHGTRLAHAHLVTVA